MSEKLKRDLRVILLAAAVFFALLIAEKSGHFDAVFENRWAKIALYMVPFLIAGHKVLWKALLGIKNLQMFDESFLMTIASIGAFVTGECEEAAAVMLFYQVGEWFQSYAVGKSRGSITALMDIVPEYANVEAEDGTITTVDPDDVEPGDVLIIKPGERIPVDAEVISGESLINTAALTGESVPRRASAGSQIISGCVNGEGLLKVRALKCYDDSTVARILELVENASEKKSRTENFITRFAKVYTPLVVAAALILAIIPSIVTGQASVWIYRACTFLVISCPCALVISVPLAFFGGIGASSRDGVLVKGSNYLELLADLSCVVSDKTGTLTEGNFRVSALECAEGASEEELLRAAAAAEGLSTHPIAVSIREAYAEKDGRELPRILDTENISGKGLSATTEEGRILVGNALLMRENGIEPVPVNDEAATVSYVAKDGRYLGAVLIRDTVKRGAAEAIRAIKDAGVSRFVMLTGDRESTARAVAGELGITECCAELLPADKVEKTEALLAEEKNGTLAFIGDGINDAPVLMRADVGIAMGSLGSDAAIEAADVVIMDDDIARLPLVIRIAGKTVRIAKENIVFALVVKVLILILGALGAANMWAAVFADVGVAVLCILNSMRLLVAGRTFL